MMSTTVNPNQYTGNALCNAQDDITEEIKTFVSGNAEFLNEAIHSDSVYTRAVAVLFLRIGNGGL